MTRYSEQLPLFPAADLRAPEPPLQRLWRCGPSALGDAELLALLLRPGHRGSCAVEMAQNVLAEEGLSRLTQWDEKSVLRCGLGETKAATLLAAVELARRLARIRMPEGRLLDHPHRVVKYLCVRYQGDQEVMGALYLDVRDRLIAEKELFRGTLNRVAVEPRAVLKHALAYHAQSFVLFHNHPSGDPTPSAEDRAITKQLCAVGRTVGISIVDHVVIGDGRFTSLADDGGLG